MLIAESVTELLSSYWYTVVHHLSNVPNKPILLLLCYQSNEETWPDQQKDNDNDNDNYNDNDNDKDNDNDI